MKRVVTVVQAAALLCALAFVVLLFANEPDDGGGEAPSARSATGPAAISGAEVFANRCASCHGKDAEGGLGPQLSGGRMVLRFPEIADQIAVISNGRGGMPGFGDRLSAEEIEAVAEYERSL